MRIGRTLFSTSLLIFALAAKALAQSDAYPSDHPSQDQILNQLVPPNGAKTLHFRGTTADLEIGDDDDSSPPQTLAIEFAGNSAALSTQAKESIGGIGAAVRADLVAGDRVVIETPPDSLANRRALAVRDWLVTQYAIEAKKLDIVSANAGTGSGAAASAHSVRIVRLGHVAPQP